MPQKQQGEAWTGFLANTSPNVSGPERVASALAGGALVGFGLKQRGVIGTVAAVVGSGMLLRGTTGHSRVYVAMGIDTLKTANAANKSPFKRGILNGRIPRIARNVAGCVDGLRKSIYISRDRQAARIATGDILLPERRDGFSSGRVWRISR
jgi:hypothetical protein